MTIRLADNILSPLGLTTADNLLAVHEGRSALRLHQLWQIPEPFMASLFEEGQLEEHSYEGALRQSIAAALAQLRKPLDLERTLLILSSTKGQTTGKQGEPMGETALRLARHFGLTMRPVTVSNACISGLSAQILAMRLLENGACDYAIVAGCDIQTKFIVSGFQSFHALSDEECRPFDEDRFGLNLGEAAATIIYGLQTTDNGLQTTDYGLQTGDRWILSRGFVRNDAFHISGPSKTGEGSYRALAIATEGMNAETLACLSPHGTATLYNDDMESRAISRANLTKVPVYGLKGYYGHTMGAAGILETILTMHALDEGWIPATRGFAACGTACDLDVTSQHRATDKQAFVKMMSGFGGCNAAAVFEKGLQTTDNGLQAGDYRRIAYIELDSKGCTLNGQSLHTEGEGRQMLTALYRQEVGDYPKFFKMDPLARVGFLAAELLLKSLDPSTAPAAEGSDCAIVLINKSASVAADRQYETTIQPGDDYFPSPGDFVYTLPNIVTGEIAIRHHLHGETTFLVIDQEDPALIGQLIGQAFLDHETRLVLGGWTECTDADSFAVRLSIYAADVE